jgi:hypothetical protein
MPVFAASARGLEAGDDDEEGDGENGERLSAVRGSVPHGFDPQNGARRPAFMCLGELTALNESPYSATVADLGSGAAGPPQT